MRQGDRGSTHNKRKNKAVTGLTDRLCGHLDSNTYLLPRVFGKIDHFVSKLLNEEVGHRAPCPFRHGQEYPWTLPRVHRRNDPRIHQTVCQRTRVLCPSTTGAWAVCPVTSADTSHTNTHHTHAQVRAASYVQFRDGVTRGRLCRGIAPGRARLVLRTVHRVFSAPRIILFFSTDPLPFFFLAHPLAHHHHHHHHQW